LENFVQETTNGRVKNSENHESSYQRVSSFKVTWPSGSSDGLS